MHDTAPKPEQPGPGYSQADWDEVSDNPKLTAEEIATLRPAREVPEVFNLLPKRGRGRPAQADAKVSLTLRIDPTLLNAYRATGAGWQVRMQEVLADGITRHAATPPGSDRGGGHVRGPARHDGQIPKNSESPKRPKARA